MPRSEDSLTGVFYSPMEPIDSLWHTLQQICSLEFVAHSQSKSGWKGRGTGAVLVESPVPAIILLQESGTWQPEGLPTSKTLHFRNTYRWTHHDNHIQLEHLRFGTDHPVPLFDLVSESNTIWSSAAPHLCRDDKYAARLEVEDSGIALHWKVIGPKKNEEIHYRYRYTAYSSVSTPIYSKRRD